MRSFALLLEVVITIAIVATLSVVLGINVKKAVSNHKIERTKKKVADTISFAKEMAEITRGDIFLDMEQEDWGTIVKVKRAEEDGILGKGSLEFFKGVYFLFKGEGEIKREVRFIFSDSGSFYPGGVLKFFDKREEELFSIDLEDGISRR